LFPLGISELLELSTGSEESFSFPCASLSINLKKELLRLWLFYCKLSCILIYHDIVELSLLLVERCQRRTDGYELVDWVFCLEPSYDTRRVIVPTKERGPIKIAVYISVAHAPRKVPLRKISLGPPAGENLKIGQRIIIV
jgi:hypothetical protein